jgi:nucleotide-binding universal stress UspA family protein
MSAPHRNVTNIEDTLEVATEEDDNSDFRGKVLHLLSTLLQVSEEEKTKIDSLQHRIDVVEDRMRSLAADIADDNIVIGNYLHDLDNRLRTLAQK